MCSVRSEIGDLKEATCIRLNGREASPAIGDRRRKIAGLVIAVLLVGMAQYVALQLIYATQPPRHTAKRK